MHQLILQTWYSHCLDAFEFYISLFCFCFFFWRALSSWAGVWELWSNRMGRTLTFCTDTWNTHTQFITGQVTYVIRSFTASGKALGMRASEQASEWDGEKHSKWQATSPTEANGKFSIRISIFIFAFRLFRSPHISHFELRYGHPKLLGCAKMKNSTDATGITARTHQVDGTDC